MESGFCNSLPISNVNSSGTIPNIVVNEVMIIGRRRRRPASWIASIKGTPSFRSSLIASSFKIESFMMIPQVTTIPIALIRFKVCPHIHNTSKEAATSIGISSRTIKGCKKLSNCAAKIKYIKRMDMNKMTTSSFSICWFEKKLPEKSMSQFVLSLDSLRTSSRIFSINCSAFST